MWGYVPTRMSGKDHLWFFVESWGCTRDCMRRSNWWPTRWPTTLSPPLLPSPFSPLPPTSHEGNTSLKLIMQHGLWMKSCLNEISTKLECQTTLCAHIYTSAHYVVCMNVNMCEYAIVWVLGLYMWTQFTCHISHNKVAAYSYRILKGMVIFLVA